MLVEVKQGALKRVTTKDLKELLAAIKKELELRGEARSDGKM